MAVSGLPHQLVKGNPIHIGTVGSGALVRVDCADAINVEIKSHRAGFDDHEWWISNLESASDVLLNGERLEQPTRLTDGDRITVAGVVICYSGGWLREDHSAARGVQVFVRDVSDKRGRTTILRSVNFIAEEGEFVGILGPSGCGKSSVIQRIAGLATFDGQIAINGHSVSEDGLRRLIAYLPQNVENALHDGLTVREEMDCNRRLFLAASDNDESEDRGYLDTLGLSDKADEPIGKLSGGQKRRVAIALALQRQPQLLLMDEPTAGLDPASEAEVMRYLQKLARQGRTVLCATHVMENVELFDNVLVLTGGDENGKSVYFDSPVSLLEHFEVKNYSELYLKLRDESKRLQPLPSSGSLTSEPWSLPEPPSRSSFLRTVFGYLNRSWKEFAAAFVRPAKWHDLLRPVCTVFLQPALIALGINFACADKFLQTPIGERLGIVIVLFCAVLSTFWLGLAGSVQSLVRERVPRRCLERLGGVSILQYGTAQILTRVGACMAQTVVFALFFYYSDGVLKQLGFHGFLKITKEHPSLLSWSWGVVSALVLVCVMGSLVGLAVSAWCRKVTAAVAAIPVIAALALFFGQPVVGFDIKIPNDNSTNPPKDIPTIVVDVKDDKAKSMNAWAVGIAEWWMPCHKAQVFATVMNVQANGKHRVFLKNEDVNREPKRLSESEKEANVKKNKIFNKALKANVMSDFLKVFVAYVIGFLLLAFAGQWCRERSWDGR